MAPIFCRLSHNASIMAEGTRITIYAKSEDARQELDRDEYSLVSEYPIEAMTNIAEGVVHILTLNEVLLLESHEPHAINFVIKGRWRR